MGLGFEWEVKKMPRSIEAFNMPQKKTENRVHLKVDKAMEGWKGK